MVSAAVVVAFATTAPATAPAANPDSPGHTPVARSAAAATSSIPRSTMCARLKSRLSSVTRQGGLFVIDADGGERLCRLKGRTRRIPASNMKLFTTATAIARFGPDDRLSTSLWRVGDVQNGVLQGSLYLVGGGDPALATPQFARRFLGGLGTNLSHLTDAVDAAGIERVAGRVFADDTIFDRLRGVADSNFATSSYIGPLSGLSFNSGYADSSARHFASDPAKVAASALVASLRGRGISVSKDVAVRKLPPDPTRSKIDAIGSPKMAALVNETDVDSNNFFAETLLKDLGARFGSGGSTRAGALVVKRFVRGLGSGVHQVDGSGLTRSNRVTPAQVARLLVARRRTEAGPSFVNALPVAGREGTVADRMHGTAAEGRCRTKTGTLTGASALSGYCFNRTGKVLAFSILMNGVGSVYDARTQQDRMAALVARY
jgi:serine-type D-Ala-D-Ala carboxypeptidase/endopeptidase (penicillin-binding protein 4)